MSELIEKKIEEVKEQRKKYLEKYKKYFEDSSIMHKGFCYKNFRQYIAKKESVLIIKRRKLQNQIFRLMIYNDKFYFSDRKIPKKAELMVGFDSKKWEIMKYLLSLIEKYAEPYKAELKRKELERLNGEYERLSGGKQTCECCGEELRDDAKFCHKCGAEEGKKTKVNKDCVEKAINTNPPAKRRECCQCTHFEENPHKKGFGNCNQLYSTHNVTDWGSEYSKHDTTGDCDYYSIKVKDEYCRFCGTKGTENAKRIIQMLGPICPKHIYLLIKDIDSYLHKYHKGWLVNNNID